MSVVVRIPNPLRTVTNGRDRIAVEGDNLEEVISALEAQHPGIRDRICTDTGELRNFVNIYVNGEDIRFLEGLKTPTRKGDEVSIVPAVAGGNQ